MNNDLLFRCYSMNLMSFMKSKGVRFEFMAKDYSSPRTFWLYIKTDKVRECLEEWNKTKPQNN